MWSGRVLGKYWALQLPAAALITIALLSIGEHMSWSPWAVWAPVALWFAKDAILYPFFWRAYDSSDPGALPYPTQGAQGTAIDRIDPTGRVRIWGELWRAQLSRATRPIEEGEPVQVKGRHGLTLLIEPAPAAAAA
jgi:membrane protein implicated in regulation of membrane protease activity